MRIAVAILTLTLTGPSVGALVCDWACAAKHQRSEASGKCHEHNAPGSTATLAAGHLCHDLTWAQASILTDARLSTVTPAEIADALFALTGEPTERVTHGAERVLRARPLLLQPPLRV